MLIDDFTLFSGVPITYKELTFRQPKLIEIGKLGERTFYDYISYFLINKDKIIENSPNAKQLQTITTTQFIMLLTLDQPEVLQKMNFLLFNITGRLLRPNSTEEDTRLELVGNPEDEPFTIEDDDWNEIVSIIRQMFCITGEVQYNVQKNTAASRIAERLKAGRKKVDSMKNTGDFQPMLGQYCSIISVGSGISLDEIINNYTLYQLLEQLKRFSKYEEYHIQLNAMVHGAKIDKLTSWYGNMNENNSKKIESDKEENSLAKMPGVQVNNKKRN